MRRHLIPFAMAVLLPVAATASPIAAGSDLNLIGFSTFNATQVTFTNPASAGATTGDFASFGSCFDCVTFSSPLTYAPFTAGLVYTADNGAGIVSTFTVESNVLTVHPSAKTLTVIDNGIATLTGFDPTSGVFTFTANEGHLTGSFSATIEAEAVAEPATLALLGVGVFGLVFARARRGPLNA